MHCSHSTSTPRDELPSVDDRIPAIGAALARHGYRLSGRREAHAGLQALVDQHQDLFRLSYLAFLNRALSFLNSKDQPRSQYKYPGALVRAGRCFSAELAMEIRVAPFAPTRPLLSLLAHLNCVRIKLFSLAGARLSLQRFGPKTDTQITVLEHTGAFWLVDKTPKPLSHQPRKAGCSPANSAASEVTPFPAPLQAALPTATSIAGPLEAGEWAAPPLCLASEKATCDDNDNEDATLHDSLTDSATARLERASSLSGSDSFHAAPQLTAFAYKQPNFKQKILFESREFLEGRIKFFFEGAEFGFITNSDNKDFFLHREDLDKAGIDADQLARLRKVAEVRVYFRYIEYQGKSRVSRKAVDVKVSEILPFVF